MKTGRVRRKDEPTSEEPKPSEEKAAAKPAEASAKQSTSKPYRPQPSSSQVQPGIGQTPKKKPGPPYLILGIMGAIFVCFVIFVIIMTLRGRADEWVSVSRVNGTWTTTVSVLGSQVKIEERWETDCVNDPNGAVRVGTCVSRDAQTYQDKVVDDYEEYAYNIYYEETWDKTYQAQGTEFVVTALGKDDWWEGNLHYVREEELDKGSCDNTNYTIWVNDPQNSSQEVEVYLAECEVWDHVVVQERVYDQKAWCQCDVTTLVEIGKQSEQGTGLNIVWPSPNVPVGGRTERTFQGQATFLGSDYTYTTTTDDLSRYQDYLTSQYYIGLRDGKPVTVSKNPDS
jgi:hypothetical protein